MGYCQNEIVLPMLRVSPESFGELCRHQHQCLLHSDSHLIDLTACVFLLFNTVIPSFQPSPSPSSRPTANPTPNPSSRVKISSNFHFKSESLLGLNAVFVCLLFISYPRRQIRQIWFSVSSFLCSYFCFLVFHSRSTQRKRSPPPHQLRLLGHHQR